jgi:oxaloacetate decarboxylase beta subunit
MNFVTLNAEPAINVGEVIKTLWQNSGLYNIFNNFLGGGWQTLAMIVIACVLLYLAIGKKFEPLLLVPIASGMLLANIGIGQIFNNLCFDSGEVHWAAFSGHGQYVINSADLLVKEGWEILKNGQVLYNGEVFGTVSGLSLTETVQILADGSVHYGENVAQSVNIFVTNGVIDLSTLASNVVLVKASLFDYLYLGVKLGIYPCLIFMGVGAMTDFSPLIANPKSLLLGAAAQLGIFVTFFIARATDFAGAEAASIGIIGGADGPTAILVTSKLAPHLLAAIAVAAYSYMALVPIIQPPIMKLLTTKKERSIVMEQLRPVSKRELVVFPIATAIAIILILPDTAPLIGSLMFGNLLRVCGVTERLSKTVQNELCNIVTIFLGTTVGATAIGATFLSLQTVLIIGMGLFAFCIGTAGGVLLGKLMCVLTGGKINPLIGSAGVSAVPMAARVSQMEGQKANPKNFLLMHAMGPNVAGVIGSAVAAGVLLAIYG